METSLIQNAANFKCLPASWAVMPFTKVMDDRSGGNLKTQKSEFKDQGLYPIIDQGQELIAGYTDNANAIVKYQEPFIVFGDHTRALKYIDFPFAMGADGTKVLKVKIGANAIEKYVYYFFLTLNIPQAGYNRHYKYLKECLIPLPNIDTQQKIAAILDKADKLRQLNKKLIEKYDALTQSLFLEMFGDPIKNDKGWVTLSGEEYFEKLTVGVVIKPASYYVAEGIIALRSLNIKPNKIDLSDLVYFDNKSHSTTLSKSILREGDVVFVRTGATGTAAIIPPKLDGCNCIDLIITRPNYRLVNPLYLIYFFNSEMGKNIVSGKEVGGIQKHFNIGAIKKLRISIPPILKQNEFAARVKSIEAQKEQSQQSFEKTEALFQSLLQKAFNGELVQQD